MFCKYFTFSRVLMATITFTSKKGMPWVSSQLLQALPVSNTLTNPQGVGGLR
jgi:hypothetical protein